MYVGIRCNTMAQSVSNISVRMTRPGSSLPIRMTRPVQSYNLSQINQSQITPVK